MADFPSSRQEADEHILKLRQERGFGVDQAHSQILVQYLDNALQILSDQLYQKSTHFLLELIQNAADNTFHDECPSLTITLEHGKLRTDCNEVGFSRKQLNALCGIGDSTKKCVGGHKGYIGEKGIGFKSVFKVADVVEIASGHYELKFDRGKELGMILPIISSFPESLRVPGHTQFLLHLRGKEEYDMILQELKNISPEILIFLPKLRRLRIVTDHGDVEYLSEAGGSDESLGGETRTVTITHFRLDLQEVRKYLIVREVLHGMAEDGRRKDVTQSEVLLAFPLQVNTGRPFPSQYTFAFLPVDDFGFRYLIQADFLLVASRESLDYTCEWNESLKGGLLRAALKAADRFSRLTASPAGHELRYAWPAYFRHQGGAPLFWNSLGSAILEKLKSLPILESRSASDGLRLPPSLTLIPDEYRLNGEPIIETSSLQGRHLAFAYDKAQAANSSVIRQLGVSTLDFCAFFNQFVAWVRNAGSDSSSNLNAKSPEWHRKIAQLLNAHASFDQLRTLRSLPIVPVRGGSWMRAEEKRLYLESKSGGEHVPNGVNILLVDPEASKDTDRRMLFEKLQVETYTESQVCALILEQHKLRPLPQRRLMDWIMDIRYLFNHRQLIADADCRKLIFATRDASQDQDFVAPAALLKASDIYAPKAAAKCELIRICHEKGLDIFPVMHPDYAKEICGGDESLREACGQWFLKPCEIDYRPWLTVEELLKLQDKEAAMDLPLLRFLKENSGLSFRGVEDFRQSFSWITVPCKDEKKQGGGEGNEGTKQPLGKVALPTKELQKSCPNIVFMDVAFMNIQDTEKGLEDWLFLDKLGVLTKVDSTAWSRQLSALSQMSPDCVDEKDVAHIYKSLGGGPSSIAELFKERDCVFIPRPPSWRSHSECLWEAPSALKSVTTLSQLYPGCRKLFQGILGVRNANAQDVIKEMDNLGGDASPEQAKQLILTLSDFIARKDAEVNWNHIQRMKEVCAYPVRGTDGPVTLQPVEADKPWYISDRTNLEEAFNGRIPLLDFSVSGVKKISALIETLHLQPRLLSRAVTESYDFEEPPIIDHERTAGLALRLPYFLSLANDAGSSNIKVEVMSVPGIRVSRRVGTVEGANDKRYIEFEQKSPELARIFLVKNPPADEQELVLVMQTKYLCGLLDVKQKHELRARLFLTASIRQIRDMLESENLPVVLPVGPTDNDNKDQASSGDKPESQSLPTGLPTGLPTSLPTSLPGTPRVLAERKNHLPLAASVNLTDRERSDDSSQQRASPQSTRSKKRIEHFSTFGGEYSSPLSPSPPKKRRYHNFGPKGSVDNPMSNNTLEYPIPLQDPFSQEAPVRTQEQKEQSRNIGFLGEKYVHDLLTEHIPGWSAKDNWTSSLREGAGVDPFEGSEMKHADFTYNDVRHCMPRVLSRFGVDLNRVVSGDRVVKYHLEVKSTINDCEEPFHLSQYQVNLAREHTIRPETKPRNIYIIVRIYNVGLDDEGSLDQKVVRVRFYVDPWRLFLDAKFGFCADTGYTVTAKGNGGGENVNGSVQNGVRMGGSVDKDGSGSGSGHTIEDEIMGDGGQVVSGEVIVID